MVRGEVEVFLHSKTLATEGEGRREGLTLGIVLVEVVVQRHPSIEVAVDQLEGIDWIKEVRGGIITYYLTDTLHTPSKFLQRLQPEVCVCE